MWGWGSKKKPDASSSSSRTNAKAASNPVENFDFTFDDPQVDEGDLDDPALLAELHKLSKGTISQQQKQTAPKSKQPQSIPRKPVHTEPEIDVDAIVGNLDMGSDDVDVEFDERDMHDPELLAALVAMGGGESDGESLASPVDLGKLDEDVEPTSVKTVLTTMEVPPAPAPIASPVRVEITQEPEPSPPPEDETVPLEYKLRSTDPIVLSKYVHLEKIRAVNKKRAGDREGAMDALRASKAIEQRLGEVNAAIEKGENVPSYKPPPLGNEASPMRREAVVRQSSVIIPVNPTNEQQVQISTSEESITLPPESTSTISFDALLKRQLEYKKFALEAKKVNDLPRAREFLTVSKVMQEVIDSVQIGGSVPEGYRIPPHPSEKPVTQTAIETPQKQVQASPAKQTPSKKAEGTPRATPLGVVVKESIDLKDVETSPSTPSPGTTHPTTTPDIFTHLETTLESQIQTCTTIAAHYYKQTKKSDALRFHKLKKTLLSDLETLRVLKSTPGANVPGFRYSTLKYEIEQVVPEVGVDEMEVLVLRAWDLGWREVRSEEVESFVAFDVGWPVEDEGGASGEGKGETGVVKKSASPEYNHSKKVKITRTRTFQRYLERKKATFEVFHYQRGFLLMGKRVSLGKVSVKMEPLLTKCEIHEVLELADPNNPRRLTGGKLEVKIRLRSPLSKPDVVVKEERWLSVDFGGGDGSSGVVHPQAVLAVPAITVETRSSSPSPASATASSVTPTSAKSATSETSASSSKLSPTTAQQKISPSSSSVGTPTSGTPKRQPSPQPETNTDLEELELKFLNPDTIVSNGVLEKEHEQIVQQITMGKKPVPEELSDRKSAYELRMNILVTLVSTGALSMEDYVKKLKESIGQTTEMAKIFKKGGKIEVAKQALVRCKIMKGEVDEIEAELAGGGG